MQTPIKYLIKHKFQNIKFLQQQTVYSAPNKTTLKIQYNKMFFD